MGLEGMGMPGMMGMGYNPMQMGGPQACLQQLSLPLLADLCSKQA